MIWSLAFSFCFTCEHRLIESLSRHIAKFAKSDANGESASSPVVETPAEQKALPGTVGIRYEYKD